MDKVKIIEAIEKFEPRIMIDTYLPMVEAWDGKSYDSAFNDGYKQAKGDILELIRLS